MRPARLLLVVLIFALTRSTATAQTSPGRLELSPFVGYLFGGRVAPSPGAEVAGAGNQRLLDHGYGGIRAAWFPSPALGVEVEVSRVTSAIAIRDLQCSDGGARCPYGASLDYLLALGVIRGSGRVQPYAEVGGGMGLLASFFGRDPDAHSATRLTAAAALGVDVALSRDFALRLDGRGYATDIDDLDVGPVCTTFHQAANGAVDPRPCRQDHWLKNEAVSAGVLVKL